jgi:ribose transport system ATP-binding protein
MTARALGAEDISKTFGSIKALRHVTVHVDKGEIHGLLGQNGSGKSTLIKILAGYHAPDPGGRVTIAGREVALPLQPSTARNAGLSFVHQDLALAEGRTILENLTVGRYSTRSFGFIRWNQERQRARELLASYGLEFEIDAPLRSLSQTDRALLAIVRAVHAASANTGGLLILDEPTVYLPQDSLDRLFAIMREVAAHGTGILFVSHQLGEVLQITERVTVLRDGSVVGTIRTAECTEEDLVDVILGRKIVQMYPGGKHEATNATILRVDGLCGRSVRNVAFTAQRGETLGLTGLVGSGYEEVPYLIFGAKPGTGTYYLDDKQHRIGHTTPQQNMLAGLALVPANRLRDGVAPQLSIEDNVALPELRRHFRWGFLRWRRMRETVLRAVRNFDVRPPEPERRIATLSGGNQQKAVLAKWLQRSQLVVLLHEPTQGVDVGSREQIFRLIREVADAGTTVVIASSEHEDLAHLCERILVFRSGRLASELAGKDVNPERILRDSYIAHLEGSER